MLFLSWIVLPLIAFTQDISIIPRPEHINRQQGSFQLPNELIICVAAGGAEKEAALFARDLKTFTGRNAVIRKGIVRPGGSGHIFLVESPADEKNPDSNSYRLLTGKKSVMIRSASARGIYYGLQTLLQIIATSDYNSLPCLEIYDRPSFSWRGMHLDVCRHFFPKEEVKKYIDYLARYKMNIFHWHLTDDQGWRIEIKKYPLLTSIGAWRSGTMVGRYDNQQFDTLRYGGFFTQEDIREIVRYAGERHITIVPEIEMPGHALAALSAYPQYSCTGGPFEPGKAWGVFDDVFCAGNDSTFLFLQNILDEVLGLFPGEYIHIGGDECPKTRWKQCPKCQYRISSLKLKDEHELQSYFVQRMEKYLNSKGRKIIGWDEILEGGLAPNAAVMSWRGTEGGEAAAREKHYAVMTPGNPCYFDHYQHPEKEKEPLAIGGLNTLQMVYDFDPVPASLKEEEKKFILGAQGNMWTEYMTDFRQVEYMALPRMAALAEVLWSGKKEKDYAGFLKRLRNQKTMLDRSGANYCKHFLE